MALYSGLDIKYITVSPYNYGPSRTHVPACNQWQIAILCPCCYAINSFISPNMRYSPDEWCTWETSWFTLDFDP